MIRRFLNDKLPEVIGLTLSFLAMGLLNYLSYVLERSSGACLDCGWGFGFPLPLYREGGFISYEEMIWIGLLADVAFTLMLGLLLGAIFRVIADKLKQQN